MSELTAAELEGIVSIDSETELVAAIEKFRAFDKKEKAAKKAKDALKSEILAALKDRGASALEFHGSIVARKSEVETVRVDAKALQAAHPRIWKKFLKVTESVRLTVK